MQDKAEELKFNAQNLSWLGSLLGLYATELLGPKDIVNRLPSIRLFAYPRGQDIIREGEQGEDMYILHKGDANVYRDGKTVAELMPGDFFGEVGFLIALQRTATVRAGKDCQVFRIKAGGFEEFMTAYPGLLEYLRRTAKRRMGQLFEKI